jgi:TatD DNase family protein
VSFIVVENHIIDSHCHLNYAEFEGDFTQMLQRAESANVRLMQTICTKMSEFEAVHQIAKSHENIFCSVGVHPHNADKDPLVSVEELLECAAHPKVIGIGETGLDYFYDYSDRAAQRASFINHIKAAQQCALPVIIHARDADDDVLSILQEQFALEPFPILIHCFTASLDFARAVINLGGYISISGIVTFKKAESLQQAVRELSLERLLIETDAPYLAPIPHRGQRNEPSYTHHVCAKVAELKGLDYETVASSTTANFLRLFNKVQVDYLP